MQLLASTPSADPTGPGRLGRPAWTAAAAAGYRNQQQAVFTNLAGGAAEHSGATC